PRLVPLQRAGVVAAQTRARQLLVALEEVGDVLARLLERFLFRRRGIDRNTEAHVAVAGMAGVAPRLPVRLEVFAELRQIDVAQTDEEPQPGASHPRKRLPGVGGHAQRRVRLLQRRRGDHRIAYLRQLQRLGERGGLAGAAAPLLHEDVDVHEYPPVAPTIPRFGYACIRAPPMARQTRSAVTGMSMCRRPSGASASLTAFISAGSAPTVPASPTPLAPSGFTRVGTSYESTSKAGTSSARGIA